MTEEIKNGFQLLEVIANTEVAGGQDQFSRYTVAPSYESRLKDDLKDMYVLASKMYQAMDKMTPEEEEEFERQKQAKGRKEEVESQAYDISVTYNRVGVNVFLLIAAGLGIYAGTTDDVNNIGTISVMGGWTFLAASGVLGSVALGEHESRKHIANNPVPEFDENKYELLTTYKEELETAKHTVESLKTAMKYFGVNMPDSEQNMPQEKPKP